MQVYCEKNLCPVDILIYWLFNMFVNAYYIILRVCTSQFKHLLYCYNLCFAIY